MRLKITCCVWSTSSWHIKLQKRRSHISTGPLAHQQPLGQRAYAHMQTSGRQLRAMSRRQEPPDLGGNQNQSDTVIADPAYSDDRQHQHKEQHGVKLLTSAQAKETDNSQYKMSSQQAQLTSHLMGAVTLTSSRSLGCMLIKPNCRMIQHCRTVSSHQSHGQNSANSCLSKERRVKPRCRWAMHNNISCNRMLNSFKTLLNIH